MTTVFHQFESPTGITLSASTYAAAQSAEVAMQALREDMEERRWQLEWERRNVED